MELQVISSMNSTTHVTKVMCMNMNIVSVSLNSLILIDQKDDDFPHFNFASAK